MKFGDAAKLIREVIDPSTVSNDTPYIGLRHISKEQLHLRGIGNVLEVTSSKQKFIAGDILFGKLRPYFRKVVAPKFDGVCSTDIWVIRPQDGFYAQFLYYWSATWIS